jgi:peptidoglycan/LPS O-acetylase OafA/YrhL
VPTKRPDIQALRAIAVLLVLAFHFRPLWVPGGFVGVDVFFVISGYLITGTLIAEATRNDSIRLLEFWGRRVRRLMPAATVVLACVLIGMALLLPVGTWPNVMTQVVASAFSFENWVLAAQSVDYLQATAPPTPVQHFWSLSVEEQFYAAWPFLLLGGLLLARKLGVRRVLVWRVATAVLFAGFLAWSIVETSLSPSTAYFSTATRAWELLLGAGLALWQPARRMPLAVASTLAIAGVAAIAAAALVISPELPFPGSIALLPTVGAALVIASGLGAPRWRWVTAGLSWRPLTWIGDISYSLYLWHWPIVVFGMTFWPIDPQLPTLWAAGGLVLSVGLAALSARFVERPFQRPLRDFSPWTVRRTAVLLASLLALTGVFVGGAGVSFGQVSEQARQDADPRNFPGANVLDPAFDPDEWNLDTDAAPIPDASLLWQIEPQLTPACMTVLAESAITSCEAGDPEGDMLVMLVGDSHAAQWLPAVDKLGQEHHWRVELVGKQYCTWSESPRLSLDTGNELPNCKEWNDNLQRYILEQDPALVIHGALPYGYPEHLSQPRGEWDDLQADGYVEAWQPVLDAGIQVVALREVPRYPASAIPCLSAPGATAEGCSYPIADVTQVSWMGMAAEREPRVGFIDLDAGICPDGRCQSILGNIYTYRDDSHLSPPFAGSLAWLLEDELRRLHPELFD